MTEDQTPQAARVRGLFDAISDAAASVGAAFVTAARPFLDLAYGYDVRESEFVADDQVIRLPDGHVFVSPRTFFAITNDDLKGRELSEAWIAHRIDLAYHRALARNDSRVDRLQEEHDDEPLSEVEKYALVRTWISGYRQDAI